MSAAASNKNLDGNAAVSTSSGILSPPPTHPGSSSHPHALSVPYSTTPTIFSSTPTPSPPISSLPILSPASALAAATFTNDLTRSISESFSASSSSSSSFSSTSSASVAPLPSKVSFTFPWLQAAESSFLSSPCLVELHVHLDGSIRGSTLYELGLSKNLLPSGVTSLESFLPHVQVSESCSSLREFLRGFFVILPIVAGDANALERISYEFVEDQYHCGIIYTEVRFSPQLFSTEKLTPKEAIQAIHKGLERGLQLFPVEVNTIFCCIADRPEWSSEVVQLAKEFSVAGTWKKVRCVAIDIAGPEMDSDEYMKKHVPAFEEARRLGIHRTVHAGEAGPAGNIKTAIELLHAERIGHGYATIENEEVWKMVKQKNIHLECCLTSSIHTAAVKRFQPNIHHHHHHSHNHSHNQHHHSHAPHTVSRVDNNSKSSCHPEQEIWHPIHFFAGDNFPFSLSTDDTIISNITLPGEFRRAVSEFGFNSAQTRKCIFNGAKASFLPEQEKKKLIEKLQKIFEM